MSDLMLRSLGPAFRPPATPDVESFRSLTLRFIDLVPVDEFESRPGEIFSDEDTLPVKKKRLKKRI